MVLKMENSATGRLGWILDTICALSLSLPSSFFYKTTSNTCTIKDSAPAGTPQGFRF